MIRATASGESRRLCREAPIVASVCPHGSETTDPIEQDHNLGVDFRLMSREISKSTSAARIPMMIGNRACDAHVLCADHRISLVTTYSVCKARRAWLRFRPKPMSLRHEASDTDFTRLPLVNAGRTTHGSAKTSRARCFKHLENTHSLTVMK
jgi:hypothetical protein